MDPSKDANHARKMSTAALLWGKAQPAVSAYIRAAVRDFHDAEDVTQATVRYLIENFDDYDPATPFAAWAIGIARYRVLEHIHQKGRTAKLLSEDVIKNLPDAFVAVEPKIGPQQEALEACMEQLSPKHKDVLYRKYYENVGHEDIAKHLGVKANTISVMLRRVRLALAQCIEKRLKTGASHG